MARRIEASHQEAFFQWLNFHPDFKDLIWHTPNGGRRDLNEARAFKRLGVRAGVPDVFIAIPSGIYPGYFIEFKSKSGKLTLVQQKMHERLIEQGYKVDTVYDWHEARVNLMQYLKGSKYDVRLHSVPQ